MRARARLTRQRSRGLRGQSLSSCSTSKSVKASITARST
jgi:hypothetical protein